MDAHPGNTSASSRTSHGEVSATPGPAPPLAPYKLPPVPRDQSPYLQRRVTVSPRSAEPSGPASSDRGGGRRWRQHWRGATLLLGVSAASLALWSTGTMDLVQLRDRIDAAGSAAPMLFVLLYAALTLLPVPKNVLSVGAGALFGFGAATLLVWVGAMAGALLAFGVARAVDPSALAWATGRHRERVDRVLRRRGVPAVVVVRLVPVAPFTAINYVSGMSSLTVRDYVVGTGVGIIPGTVVYVAVGAFGLNGPGHLGAAAAALVALVVLGGLWSRRLRAKDGTPDRGPSNGSGGPRSGPGLHSGPKD